MRLGSIPHFINSSWEKLGVILIQVPGKLEFNLKNAERFYKIIREVCPGPFAIEPRNTSWVSVDAQKLMIDRKISN